MSNLLTSLQNWYKSKCDGVWEHSYGIEIDTLDNPGWRVSLSGENNKKNINIFLERSDKNWVSIKADSNEFVAYGGIDNLDEMLHHALIWIKNEKIVLDD
ncbi:Imm53 family immunity protein [Neisseria zalophi]|uniref:Rhodanese-related sulfurtransferase n=1 Tax=Neisseria zalophi TaxID=640030 RepID=A0A5J6PSI1_9NEIS|nr:Imm53 family immunity protein [Neisseria zalophi]QEY25316.1 hypothetical protein D0T92_01330 [Neisseria zalophi]